MMGRGKSSAAIRYMKDSAGSRRFLYITPYLSEVERVCDTCDFDQPDDESGSKLSRLKSIMRRGENVAATHALFMKMDEELLSIAADRHYSLICDEELDVASQLMISDKDMKQLQLELVTIDEDGRLHWNDDQYIGKYDVFKEVITNHKVHKLDTAWVRIINPEIFQAFDEIFILTYMFNGQYQRAYFDAIGVDYDIIGIKKDGGRYQFSEEPDKPDHMDYRSLITMVDGERMNGVGARRTALSKNWYSRHSRNSEEIVMLRKNMANFFRNGTNSKSDTRLWTCYKSEYEKLIGDRGRFRSNFLFLNAKSTNAYRNCDTIAYMVNLFPNPNLEKIFGSNGASLDPGEYALSSMLQFIWRSSIRDGKPIDLYLPSARMRSLLNGWIEENS